MSQRIGDYLVQIGVMKQTQVDEIVTLQGGGDGRKFGEIAIEKGWIDDEALKRYIMQKDA